MRIFLAAGALVIAHPVVAQDTTTLDDPAEAFEVDLPEDCRIAPRNLQMDFEVLDITCRDVPMVGIYVGNHPSGDGGRVFSTPYRWPATIHVWVVEATTDRPRAERIAASVRPASF
ncbi:MAG: hypothetical protein K2X07_07715 [Caulobacteraceae bacterium]|nr:hypothetical protein [Caulobacteraceae bacterium]